MNTYGLECSYTFHQIPPALASAHFISFESVILCSKLVLAEVVRVWGTVVPRATNGVLVLIFKLCSEFSFSEFLWGKVAITLVVTVRRRCGTIIDFVLKFLGAKNTSCSHFYLYIYTCVFYRENSRKNDLILIKCNINLYIRDWVPKPYRLGYGNGLFGGACTPKLFFLPFCHNFSKLSKLFFNHCFKFQNMHKLVSKTTILDPTVPEIQSGKHRTLSPMLFL